jgi:hypothetical protein
VLKIHAKLQRMIPGGFAHVIEDLKNIFVFAGNAAFRKKPTPSASWLLLPPPPHKKSF